MWLLFEFSTVITYKLSGQCNKRNKALLQDNYNVVNCIKLMPNSVSLEYIRIFKENVMIEMMKPKNKISKLTRCFEGCCYGGNVIPFDRLLQRCII